MNCTEDMRRNDSEDLGWIIKVKQGNRHLFEKLVLKYQKRIYYTARKIVLDHDDTNDIVQETFIKVYMHLDRFDEALPFYPWLQKIAVNTALNHLSHVKRRREAPVETSDGLPR